MDTAEMSRLRNRIAEIAVDAEIDISPPRNDITLPARFAERAAQLVEKWLLTDNPAPGAHYIITLPTSNELTARGFGEDIKSSAYPADVIIRHQLDAEYRSVVLRVFRRGRGLSHVEAWLGTRPFFVDATTMRKNIHGKVLKYARSGLPIVVAVVADPMTGISQIEFEEVLLSQSRMLLNFTGPEIREMQTREPGGFLTTFSLSEEVQERNDLPEIQIISKALSAVILVERSAEGLWTLTGFTNPVAETSIWFEGLRDPSQV